MIFKWVPEAPNYPGVYGIAPVNEATCTRDVNEALQFATKEECRTWCDANPAPPFVPREHGWG